MADAVFGASRKGCGAPACRGPRLLSVWQPQYLEPVERVAARLVAVGRGSCRGRRSTWSRLRRGGSCPCGRRSTLRALLPWAAAAVCVAGAILGASRKSCGAPGRRGPRLLSVGQAQYLEPLERVAAPGRRGPRLSVWQAHYLEPSRKGCSAPSRRGPRLLSVWQAQYLEPPCVNVVGGSPANRGCEHIAVMFSWRAGLAPCCV